MSTRDGAHDALANPHEGAQGSGQDALRPVTDIKARLGEWKDELVKLEQMMDAELLSPAQREWLGQAIETCQSKVRLLEAEMELEETKDAIEQHKVELRAEGVFACNGIDETCGGNEEDE